MYIPPAGGTEQYKPSNGQMRRNENEYGMLDRPRTNRKFWLRAVFVLPRLMSYGRLGTENIVICDVSCNATIKGDVMLMANNAIQ